MSRFRQLVQRRRVPVTASKHVVVPNFETLLVLVVGEGSGNDQQRKRRRS